MGPINGGHLVGKYLKEVTNTEIAFGLSGGHIDLSGLQRIKGATRSEDYLQINYDNGSIDLSSLRWVDYGYTRFLVTGAVCTLTSLESVVGTTFQTNYSVTPVATSINLPVMTNHDGGSYIVQNAKVVQDPLGLGG